MDKPSWDEPVRAFFIPVKEVPDAEKAKKALLLSRLS